MTEPPTDAKPPHSGSWKGPAATSHKLRLWLDASVAKHGWTKAYEAGREKFNELIAAHDINLTVEKAANLANSDVVGYAQDGDITVTRPGKPTETIRFDSTTVHGYCLAQWEGTTSRGATTWLIEKARIYVPAKAGFKESGNKRKVGEGVRIAIVVHELIHAAGLQDNSLHTTNDVFAWPLLEMGATDKDDRFVVATGLKVPLSPKFPDRLVPEKLKMPPIVLKVETVRLLVPIWGTKP